MRDSGLILLQTVPRHIKVHKLKEDIEKVRIMKIEGRNCLKSKFELLQVLLWKPIGDILNSYQCMIYIDKHVCLLDITDNYIFWEMKVVSPQNYHFFFGNTV